MLFFGDQDAFIPNDEVAKIEADAGRPEEDRRGEGLPRCATRLLLQRRDSYRADAAKDAWERLTTFLALI
jgi:dienelactone hydrolase